MTRILRIDSSARPASSGSRGRELADGIAACLQAKHPDAELVTRDLAGAPLPHISDETIAGFYTPPEQLSDGLKNALALSDALIAELRSADAANVEVSVSDALRGIAAHFDT